MWSYIKSCLQAFIITIIIIIAEVLITNEINGTFAALIFCLSHIYFLIDNEKKED